MPSLRSPVSPSGPEPLEPRDLPTAEPFNQLPVLPQYDPETLANVHRIAYTGALNGIRADAFIKLGDSNTAIPDFLFPLGRPDYNPFASGLGFLSPAAREAFTAFRAPIDAAGANSFSRVSRAAWPGWTLPQMMAGVDAELAQTHAGVALILAGTNDLVRADDPTEFRGQLTALVERLSAAGVVSVLTTIPHNLKGGDDTDRRVPAFNQAIADVAADERVPLFNLWRAVEGLPLHGLKALFDPANGLNWPDLVHLAVSPSGGGGLTPVDQLYGQNLRTADTLELLGDLRSRMAFRTPAAPSDMSADWTPLTPGQAVFATGAGPGSAPVVTVTDADTGTVLNRFLAYDNGFYGGVNVAVGDVNGDGVPDVVTTPGIGGGPLVRAFSGTDGRELFSFWAFEPSFTGGVSVAVGDVDGDGRPDVVVGAGQGGSPRVRVFRTDDQSITRDFFAFDPGFTGGVTVAAGTFGIAVGAGAGGGPVVALFDGATGAERAAATVGDPGRRGGVSVAAGDLDGDGRDELVAGAGDPVVFNVVDPVSAAANAITLDGIPSEPVVRPAISRGRLAAVTGPGEVVPVRPAG